MVRCLLMPQTEPLLATRPRLSCQQVLPARTDHDDDKAVLIGDQVVHLVKYLLDKFAALAEPLGEEGVRVNLYQFTMGITVIRSCQMSLTYQITAQGACVLVRGTATSCLSLVDRREESD